MLSTLANSEICSVTSVTCSWCWYNALTLFFLLSKIKNVIFFIIFRSKINCSHHLWESKVLGSWKFIFIRRNNIVKTINYVSFYFSYSLNVRWHTKKQNQKKKHTHNWQNLCERDAHESVSVMEISQTPGSHVRCLLYIDLHCVLRSLLPRQRGLGLNFGFLFFFSFSQKSPSGIYSACVKSPETEHPLRVWWVVFRRARRWQFTCRFHDLQTMKLDRNEDILWGRPPRKDVERNASIWKPLREINLRANIYEWTYRELCYPK